MSAPAVSVVVPAHDRPDGLDALLAVLARLEAPPGGFEVVVVDDGSPCPLRPAAPDGLELRVLRRPNGGPAAARNAGVLAARGALLAFTDDDCLPDPGWLVRLTAAAAAHPGALVAGRSVCGLPGNAWAESSQALEDAVYGRANGDPARARFGASKNLAVRRDALLAAGGFDERFRAAEDRELCARWLAQGRPLVFERAAVVRHRNPASGGVFWRQHVLYGRGAFHFHRRGPDTRLEIDPLDYLAFAREPLRGPRRSGLPRLAVLGLVVLSQTASALGYALEAARAARGRGVWTGAPRRAVA